MKVPAARCSRATERAKGGAQPRVELLVRPFVKVQRQGKEVSHLTGATATRRSTPRGWLCSERQQSFIGSRGRATARALRSDRPPADRRGAPTDCPDRRTRSGGANQAGGHRPPDRIAVEDCSLNPSVSPEQLVEQAADAGMSPVDGALGLHEVDDAFDLRVHLSKQRLLVAPVQRVIHARRTVHVLLRHRLLRQPGGFERFLSGEVLAPRGNLAVPNCEDDRVADVDLHVAVLHPPHAADEGYNLVPCIDQLLGLHPALLERLLPLAVVVAQRVGALHQPDVIERALGRSPVDVRMPELSEPVQAAPVIRGEVLPHDLHVLLRHRPRSIPPGERIRDLSGARAYTPLAPAWTADGARLEEHPPPPRSEKW